MLYPYCAPMPNTAYAWQLYLHSQLLHWRCVFYRRVPFGVSNTWRCVCYRRVPFGVSNMSEMLLCMVSVLCMMSCIVSCVVSSMVSSILLCVVSCMVSCCRLSCLLRVCLQATASSWCLPPRIGAYEHHPLLVHPPPPPLPSFCFFLPCIRHYHHRPSAPLPARPLGRSQRRCWKIRK